MEIQLRIAKYAENGPLAPLNTNAQRS